MERLSKNMNKKQPVSKKFRKLVEEFMKEHAGVLKELAKR